MKRVLMTFCLIMCGLGAVAEDENEDFETLKKYYRLLAKDFEFTLDARGQKKLDMHGPVFTWTGQDYLESSDTIAPISGEVFVWTYQGRAIVAGGVLSFPHDIGRNVIHEFQSLVETPPQSVLSPSKWGQNWRPKGIRPREIPGASKPYVGTTRVAIVRRNAQMRMLARQFSADTRSAATRKVHPLKLQSNALFRLDTEELKKANSHVIDGSLFIFTNQLGTDPESTLLIECHQTEDGLKWMYTPGSMAFQELWLKHKGKQVWHLPNYNEAPGEGNFVSSLNRRLIKMDQIKAELRE